MGKDNKPDKEHKKEKKKKRPSDQTEAAELVKKCRIEFQPPPETELPVTACYFAAGPAPDGASYSLYQSGITTRPNYTLLGTKDKISFVGTTQGEQYAGTQASMCSQVVGVYNKATGQLQLLPIAGGRVLRMEPRLPGLDYDRAGASDPSVLDEGPETREQLMAENKRLVAQFGSTRRRRQLNAREEGVVRAEKLGESGEALGMLMMGIAQKAAEEGFTKNQVAAQANASRHLPPHELDATTPQAAYPLAQLLPPEIASSLRITLLMKAATDDDAMQEFSEKKSSNPYILNRLSILRDQSDMNACKKRARLLAYLSVLMRLRMGRPTLLADGGDGTPGEGLANLARNIGTSPDILEPLLAKFYNASKEDHTTRYARSKAGETLLQAYICVVALLAEPGAALAGQSVQEMADTLKISVADLVQRFREVGAECKQVQVKHEDGSSTRMYNAVLMPDPNKTLRECLPAIKLMPQRAKK